MSRGCGPAAGSCSWWATHSTPVPTPVALAISSRRVLALRRPAHHTNTTQAAGVMVGWWDGGVMGGRHCLDELWLPAGRCLGQGIMAPAFVTAPFQLPAPAGARPLSPGGGTHPRLVLAAYSLPGSGGGVHACQLLPGRPALPRPAPPRHATGCAGVTLAKRTSCMG